MEYIPDEVKANLNFVEKRASQRSLGFAAVALPCYSLPASG